ncbi:MAG: PIN domain-containing protein [Holophagaceae bacterium]|nr:PIN domain-containing protein [Holophagaceae bacterium]
MASYFLIDTNVISLIIDAENNLVADPQKLIEAQWYLEKISNSHLILSFATIAELKRWSVSRRNLQNRKRIEKEVNAIINKSYVVYPTEDTLNSWAEIAHEAVLRNQFKIKNSGSSQINDLWIAAIAKTHRLILLTNDHGFDWMAELGIQTLRYGVES